MLFPKIVIDFLQKSKYTEIVEVGDNLESVLKYINYNIKSNLSLESMAKLSGYSVWHFCEKFKSFTGTTFTHYVRNRKMQLAAMEIIKGRKIIDIAMEFGYDSPGGFNKAFMTYFRCMPTEFKKDELKYRKEYERRCEQMYKLSDRCAFLREKVVNEKVLQQKIRGQYMYHYLKGYYDVAPENRNNAVCLASSIKGAVLGTPPIIIDGEIIVGYNFADDGIVTTLDETFFFDRFNHSDEFDDFKNIFFPAGGNGLTEQNFMAYLEDSELTDEQKKFICDSMTGSSDRFMYPYKAHNSHPSDKLNDIEKTMFDEMASTGYLITHNHSVLDYKKVIELGFEGILAQVKAHRAKNEPLSQEQTELYDALQIVCEAGLGIGEKYALHASELAKSAEGARKNELELIAKVCKNVPAKPATSFIEAVQSLWFAHIINTYEDGINANSIGRLDQILYPYYKADLEKGVITKEQAFEIICLLWLKLYRDYDVQQATLAGRDSDGNTLVNDLTYMMLDATEALDFIRCISVRYDQNTDKEFMKRALEVVGHVGKGVPFFFNDDVMIKSLENFGVLHEDATNYAAIGCIETVIPGKSNPHAVSTRCNLLKALEYTLADGESMLNPGKKAGLKTGNIESFKSYADFEKAVFEQIKYIIDVGCKGTALSVEDSAKNFPLPYKSLLTEGCVENGKDFNNHGAKYDFYQVMLLAIPNLADSLAAIKKLVFEEKRYTLKQVVEFLKNDWQDEAIRLDFVNKSPKFGNDIDYVDNIAVKIMDFCCDFIPQLSEKYGIQFHPQPFTYLWMVDHGARTAATPDGRHCGEVIAYSVSPMQGRDFNGFTALLNSLAKFPTTKTPGTTSAIVEVDPLLFTDKNIGVFADIMYSASKNGLCNVQYNTIDADTLIDAQKNPDKHRNHAVRVSGFSQKFYLLDKKLQDHIICRTKHKYL